MDGEGGLRPAPPRTGPNDAPRRRFRRAGRDVAQAPPAVAAPAPFIRQQGCAASDQPTPGPSRKREGGTGA